MNKRILIIGSKGMAGHLLYYYFKERKGFHVADISRSADFFASAYQLDVTDLASLLNVLKQEKPGIVINCTGILNTAANTHPDKAIFINSYLTHWLAKTGDELGYRLIHLSTDCVFNGRRGNYTETDLPDGLDMYSRTKALGEVYYDSHLNLRTSIIGPELKTDGIGLFNWFMHQEKNIQGYVNAIWTGVTTLELAKSIEKAINNNVTGLYQLVNGTKISKYELLVLFKKVFNKDTIVIEKFTKSALSDKSLISSRNELPVKGYEDMLIEMKEWMCNHKEMYAQYFQQA